MKRRSTKRAKEERQYSAQRKVYLEKHPYCEAALDNCVGASSQIHHRAGRVGKLLLDQTRWLSVCYRCHDWIEMHAIEAKELGLSESRLAVDHE